MPRLRSFHTRQPDDSWIVSSFSVGIASHPSLDRQVPWSNFPPVSGASSMWSSIFVRNLNSDFATMLSQLVFLNEVGFVPIRSIYTALYIFTAAIKAAASGIIYMVHCPTSRFCQGVRLAATAMVFFCAVMAWLFASICIGHGGITS